MNRTVQAASNLRKTILDTITYRQPIPQPNTEKIFSGTDEDIGDPLAGATNEHVERIILSSGGPVATVKKYSADLAETHDRVTAERNSKVRLVEENRGLRAGLQDKEQAVEDLQKLLATTKRLFERYVGKMQPELGPIPQLQILDSPAGPYALGMKLYIPCAMRLSSSQCVEDSSGTILATVDDDFVFPESSSVSHSGTSSPSPAMERLTSQLQLDKCELIESVSATNAN
jgi:hypothetical protein